MAPIVNELKQAGYKITAPRKSILDVLAPQPRSAQEIAGLLQKKAQTVDLVTIYRTLELFTELGLVSKTQFTDSIARYELASDSHHHHLVCQKCQGVEDVAFDERSLIKEVTHKSKFKIHSHSLEFFGLCARCQT